MHLKWLLIFLALQSHDMVPENKNFIDQFCSGKITHPFSYDLHVTLRKANKATDTYMLCFHGSGENYTIVDRLQSYHVIADNLVSFNFPDHDTSNVQLDPHASSYGTIQELLPALYVLKNLIVDGKLTAINLYGFSAGGGVLVNILAILSGSRFAQELQTIGIDEHNKQQILSAIQQGLIIFDCPLKSIEEIMALRGNKNAQLTYVLQTYAAHYAQNKLRPIDAITQWKNLTLNILLYFENPDEILSNRDDELYAQRLRMHHAGTTHIISSSHGGHNAQHFALWNAYTKLLQQHAL